MTRITVLGGTGYAGGHISRAAAARGHQVTVIARSVPADPTTGVRYRTGDVQDPDVLAHVADDAEVVISALAPRGPLDGALGAILREVAGITRTAGIRLGVIGGAGSLQATPGGPLLAEGPDFPEAFRSEATQMAAVLDDLRATPADLDWFLVSPAAEFGAHAPGRRVGSYRIGGDVLLIDGDGHSRISGEDLADAVIDEVERPAHHRSRFTVAY